MSRFVTFDEIEVRQAEIEGAGPRRSASLTTSVSESITGWKNKPIIQRQEKGKRAGPH